MSDEDLAEVTPAPEPEATAAPAPENETPESEKTFTQAELDAILKKRLDRERRSWERAQKAPEPAPLPPVAEFESEDAYRAAVIEQHEASKQKAAMDAQFMERVEKAAEKYDDFEQVAYNPALKISDVMAQAIQASEVGPDVAYYIGLNPAEAERIYKLPPLLQAKEIGRLEAKVAAEPPTRKVTNAPEPIQPGRLRGAQAPVVDTTDPRSINTMSTSEWIAAEQRRLAKKAGII